MPPIPRRRMISSDETTVETPISTTQEDESASRPKRKPRVPKLKPLTFDSLPDVMVVRMSDTILTIVQLLIEHFEFNASIDSQTMFIKKLYMFNREIENKADFVLVINKGNRSMTIDRASTFTSFGITESQVLTALEGFKLHCARIDNNPGYDETKYFLAKLTSYVFPSNSAKIDSVNGNISINQRRVNSNIQRLDGTPLEVSTMMYLIGDYAVIKNINNQSILLVNKNFPFSPQGIIAVQPQTNSVSYVSFGDLKTKYEYVTNITNFNQQKVPLTIRSETKYSKTYLREQIRTRYFMPRPNRGNHTNIVVDSYLPYQLYQDTTTSFDRNFNLSKTSAGECHYAVSRLAADILKATPISIDTMCKTVGFTQKQIKDLLTKVKSKEIYPVFVGAGGTNMNTLYWLNELCSYANVMNLFSRGIAVHEPEQIEFSNMLRFPMPLSAYTSLNLREDAIPYKILLLHNLKNLTNSLNTIRDYVNDITVKSYCQAGTENLIKGVVFYGAPDINSRKLLAPYGNFIAATHANNSCSIWLNPIQNSDIQVESYGLIQLNTFFMNQFRMAIEFLNILASDQDLKVSDTRLFSYSFNGIPESTIDRKLYWQIEQNMEMTPEI